MQTLLGRVVGCMTHKDRIRSSFLFVRHGETEFNRTGRFLGAKDVPLNETGEAQAQQVAEIFVNCGIHRIVASPANRVLKTAAMVALRTGVGMHIEADLTELHVGAFEGQKIADVKAAHGLAANESFLKILPPDAEQWASFKVRVYRAVARWVNASPDQLILIAAHGLVFRALVEDLTGETRTSGNAVPFRFECQQHNNTHQHNNTWLVQKISP